MLILVACGGKPAKQQTEAESFVNEAVNMFTWDVEKMEKGVMMFLDVPYTSTDSIEYLSLTVAKEWSDQRPEFISVIVPIDVDPSSGVRLLFMKNDFAKTRKIYLKLEPSENDFLVSRIMKGYSADAEDVFQCFLNYNQVFFDFVKLNGDSVSVSVPLYTFQKQYSELN